MGKLSGSPAGALVHKQELADNVSVHCLTIFWKGGGLVRYLTDNNLLLSIA